jgi:glycosyltransferase involved in cell wall biosynthesis
LFRFFCFFKFNTFHFYYGTSLFPLRMDLPLYKLFGKKVIMEYLGTDCQLYEYSVKKYKWNNSSGQFINEELGKLHDKKITKRYLFEKKFIDQSFVCSPNFSEFVENSLVLPLAIDLTKYNYLPIKEKEFIHILHAPTDKGFKGTSYIVDAVNRLIKEGHKIKLVLVENLSHDKLQEKYAECDIFIDQILAGWYGTASIEAMTAGRPVICFIRNSYFEYCNLNFKEVPIISANPDDIYEVLKNTIQLDRKTLNQIGQDSRKFVENYHDSKKVTKFLIEQYNEVWEN